MKSGDLLMEDGEVKGGTTEALVDYLLSRWLFPSFSFSLLFSLSYLLFPSIGAQTVSMRKYFC